MDKILPVHSISAGLDYPGIGPEHSYLHDINRAIYAPITDDEAMQALILVTRKEGIIPAIESAHALAYLEKLCPTLSKDKRETIIVNVSGRGDKDMHTVFFSIEGRKMFMNSIKSVFERKKQNNEKTNIGYVVAGYPSVDFTKNFLSNLDKTSIDILEIGIPYSDPLADGKLISEASFKASQAGVTTDTVFELLTEVKDKVSKPLVFLVYYNLIFSYGIDNFLKKMYRK